ncbi:MAG: DUF2726 domain-containing protein [Rubrivivax sp.]|nr:DUF2726 domain-containing protein [Rubrivivax sp.]
MELSSFIASFALPATLLLLLALVLLRLRQRVQQRRARQQEVVDTLTGWPPESVRVLSITERQAYDLLRRAMPGFLVMAQVPLARFIRVPARRSYTEWLQRVGSLSADLMLCDSGSRVLAVIDIRNAQESERSRRRHERMARVLRAARIPVYEWREGHLPTATEARGAFAPLLGPAASGIKPTVSRPMPLMPLPEMMELLSEGDRAAFEAQNDAAHEPVPSAFMDDLEATAAAH